MQFQVTYNRPFRRGRKTVVDRQIASWRNTTPELVANFIQAYEDHGFSTYKVTNHKWILSKPSDGTRIVETQGE